MFKLFYSFLSKRLLPGNKKQTIYASKFLVFNSIKFKPPKMVMLNFFSLLILLFSANCCTTEPQLEPELFLKLEDVSCTEAWLQLSSANIQIPNSISLLINNTVAKTFSLSTQDTLLYIDSLLPNHSYKFKVVANTTNNPQPTTNEVLAQTMDTTSHNFTWQTFEFGQHSSSVLYDVAIINENDIWAVGEIYMNDSLGNPDPTLYNLVKWDGTRWKPERVYYNYQGSDFIAPIHSIFGFTLNDVWVGSNQPMRWNGNIWQKWDLLGNIWNGWINKIWGSSINDLYIVGNGGNIAHYGGPSVGWKKIESGTELPFNDIWGINDNGKTKILVVASNIYQFQDKKILSIGSSGVTEISNTGLPLDLGSIWFSNIYNSYVGGDGLYVKYFSQNYWDRIELPTYFIFSIRGNELNDMMVCGGLGYVGHFNGSTWINYLENGINEILGNYYSSDLKENKFVAVGGIMGGKAIAIIGAR